MTKHDPHDSRQRQAPWRLDFTHPHRPFLDFRTTHLTSEPSPAATPISSAVQLLSHPRLTRPELMDASSSCWACRQRRVRCDLTQPACTRCVTKGIVCPGYGKTRPRRWKHYVPSISESPAASTTICTQLPGIVHARQDDIAPAATILDTLLYCWFFFSLDVEHISGLELTSPRRREDRTRPVSRPSLDIHVPVWHQRLARLRPCGAPSADVRRGSSPGYSN